MKIQVLKYMFDWCLMPTLAVFQLCHGVLKYRILGLRKIHVVKMNIEHPK